MTTTNQPTSAQDRVWADRAVRLLEQALSETRDGLDSIPTVTAALAALRIEVGELSADEMDGYRFPGEDDERECTCPPDLTARGGWSSRCSLHGSWMTVGADTDGV